MSKIRETQNMSQRVLTMNKNLAAKYSLDFDLLKTELHLKTPK